MKQSIHIPVVHQAFEIYDFCHSNQSFDLLKKYNDSAEKFYQLDPLFRLHTHDVIEILVFLGGECDFFCEGKTYTLRKGDVIVVPPYAVHQAIVKNIDSYQRIVINISNRLMADFGSSSPSMNEQIMYQKTQGSYLLHLSKANFQTITSLLHEISTRKQKGEENFSFTLQYLLFQVLQVIFTSVGSLQGNKEDHDERLVSILEYIEAHVADPYLSLDKVSSYFHLNKYYFSHYFKKQMNLPFYRYVSLKRLSYAVTLIKQNQLPIEQIAIQCGFPDYSSFYRLFKKEYNLSPKKLQKEYKY
jgi:AraC-like DNA-binding protein